MTFPGHFPLLSISSTGKYCPDFPGFPGFPGHVGTLLVTRPPMG